MRSRLIKLGAVVATAIGLSLAMVMPASAIPPPGHWTLTGKTPISSGYMYTYHNAAGAVYVSAQFHGYSFDTFDVREK